MSSIHGKLSRHLLVLMALVLGLGGVALHFTVRALLTAQFDESLLGRLSMIRTASRLEEEGIELEVEPGEVPEFRAGPDAEYFEFGVVGPPRRPVAKSESLGEQGILGGERAGVPIDVTLPDGRRGRAVSEEYKPLVDEKLLGAAPEVPDVYAVVARSRRPLDRAIALIDGAIGAVWAMMCIAMLVGARVALARGLRPLETISAGAQAMGTESLASGLSRDGVPAELLPVVDRLNQMLARVGQAFEREQRFSSAAAHELRTPVAELRSMLEVSLSRERSAEEWRTVLRSALDVTLQMERIIGALLQTSRGRAVTRAPVEMRAIVQAVVARWNPAAAARSGEIVLEAQREVWALAEATLAEAIVENIISNAVEHGSSGTSIRVSVLSEGGRCIIDCIGMSHGVTHEDLPRFFEPFWRKSESRSERRHLGLGLAVSREFAAQLGGSIVAELLAEEVLRVRIELIGAEPPRSAPETYSLA